MLIAPVLVALIGLMFGAGKILLEHQEIVGAAGTAVEAAVIAPTPVLAAHDAESNVTDQLDGEGASCSPLAVATDVSHFVPGGSVSVTVSCRAALVHLAFSGLPGHVLLTATGTAVVEPHRQLQS